jgi:hypothetical protein
MGNQPSALSSESPVVYCDSVCQRERKLKNLWNDYQNLVKEEDDLPKKVWSAKYNYYSMKDGPQWLQNYKNSELNQKLQKIREEKQKIINILTKTYNDKLQIVYTQNNLINKQNRLINRNNKNSSIQLNEIGEMTEIITTNNRQVYFKELDYKIKSQKISRLNIFLFFLILLMIVIIILYILNSTNINISFENLKSSSSNKINEWRKPVQSNMD